MKRIGNLWVRLRTPLVDLQIILPILCILLLMSPLTAQTPAIEPGVSLELAKWRAAHYSDVRYKLSLTLEKMSPVLKGTMEIRLKLSEPPASAGGQKDRGPALPIILDWRRIKGHEEKSTISNVSVNGKSVSLSTNWPPANAGGSDFNEHLIFRDGVVAGENVIKLDFTSPILTSGSAITRYVDKEDGSEYIYSLFVPSDASTAFPVFDQPDMKARFELELTVPKDWSVVTNSTSKYTNVGIYDLTEKKIVSPPDSFHRTIFEVTKPISTYVFAFAAGPWERVSEGGNPSGSEGAPQQVISSQGTLPTGRVSASPSDRNVKPELKEVYKKWLQNDCCGIMTAAELSAFKTQTDEPLQTCIYVRRSQVQKFKPHAAEVFRLNREAIKYFEQYFDYKFPFPKYDLVLIPEFPFGGMEHAGATFLRESSIIFPQEPTKSDHISRALLMFHEASHQWFGDTVTMRWFDDLWLKEGFATFTAYKAMEKIMPEMNAWKVFYERVKQAAYQTDSTKGTTPIYQEIPNLSAAKSAYGAIVYSKAPSFLKQAEFYIGADNFQKAVRSLLKKHEFANAGWEDLVKEFESTTPYGEHYLRDWALKWVKEKGVPKFKVRSQIFHSSGGAGTGTSYSLDQDTEFDRQTFWKQRLKLLLRTDQDSVVMPDYVFDLPHVGKRDSGAWTKGFLGISPWREIKKGPYTKQESSDLFVGKVEPTFVFPNYQDYGYGIFLLDPKSRDYVLKNIQNEKDPFLRSMMWGALWDSVREGELDPKVFLETAIKNLPSEQDETMAASIASRAGTALNYYVSDKTRVELAIRIENVFSDKMRTAETLGQRITFYRAFLNIASSENARKVLKEMLRNAGIPAGNESDSAKSDRAKKDAGKGAGVPSVPLKTKDKFDIVTRLLILGDTDASRLLAELEKTETGDDAKRYAYAAKAGIATAENKAKYWKDFTENKEISESWIEAAFGPWNSIRHSELTLPYLERALKELPNHKRNRKIFFVNGWLGAFIGGQRSEEALGIINKFLADNPNLDRDLRLKILENADVIERAVKIRKKWNH